MVSGFCLTKNFFMVSLKTKCKVIKLNKKGGKNEKNIFKLVAHFISNSSSRNLAS
jgi:hypothetical protein